MTRAAQARWLTRRQVIRLGTGLGGVLLATPLLAACAPAAAPPQPTSAPAPKADAKPTEAPKPAAQAPAAKAGGAAKLSLKLGHIAQVDQPHDQAAKKLAELVAQKSNGEIEVEVFPAAQLGADPQLLQGLQQGSLQISLVGDGSLAAPVPQYHWSLVPFGLKGEPHYSKILTSGLQKELGEELLAKTGIRVLSDWYRTARQLTHRDKPIKSADDAKGVRLRVAQVPLYTDAYSDMGFNVTPMNLGELYTAFQQGVVDAWEGQNEWTWGFAYYEQQKYLMLTQHCFGVYCVGVNDKWFQGLSADYRKVLEDASTEAGEFNKKVVIEFDADLVDKLKGKGMTVLQPNEIDRESFAKISQEKSVPRYEGAWGAGFYDKLQSMA
jgi:TRAP-type transport system periplasmic protein